jgi:hypothetical protein
MIPMLKIKAGGGYENVFGEDMNGAMVIEK